MLFGKILLEKPFNVQKGSRVGGGIPHPRGEFTYPGLERPWGGLLGNQNGRVFLA